MRSRGNFLFLAFFTAFAATAIAWLIFGLLPAIASAEPAFHDLLHRVRAPFEELGRNAAQASHGSRAPAQVALDYVFSLLNLGLAALVVYLRPHDRAARLLAVAMVGTAVAFNLQGHDALQVLPTAWLGPVDAWHALTHIVAGLCYVGALLLFPDGTPGPAGRIWGRVRPYLFFLGLPILLMLSAATLDDHTLGLVLLFGIVIPVVGVIAQVGRYRHATDNNMRQRSRVVLIAVGAAFLAAGILIFATDATAPATERRTLTYEVSIEKPGTYFFRCDPHPEKMIGVVTVEPGGPSEVEISAVRSEFDRETITLAAGSPVKIDFTNNDSDLHNVAIYESHTANDPIFIGAEFSGHSTAVTAFRTFRIIFTVIPLALIAGLLRMRLWDVNRVVNKALLYGGLAGVITLAYLGAVAAVGAIFGGGRQVDLVVSVTLTLVIAMLFQPLRDRARRVANRMVYGKRISPYDVITDLSRRAVIAEDIDREMPVLAEAVGHALAAQHVQVWLRVGDELRPAATWPEGNPTTTRTIPVVHELLPEIGEVDRVAPVSDDGVLVGAIGVTKPPSDPPTEADERLLEDVAAQAALLLRSARLAAELRDRLEELRASRERLVTVQDEERRRLERDLHDGAQQHLVAIAMKLQRARTNGASSIAPVLDELDQDVADALQNLRDLGRGIYPPVLADRGLGIALEAHARRCAETVNVHADHVPRLDPRIENAVYFCCLEAIQNALKHGAPPVDVTLKQDDGYLDIEITDRGRGVRSASSTGSGVQNMQDRMAAIGGELSIAANRSGGTSVVARVPLGTDSRAS